MQDIDPRVGTALENLEPRLADAAREAVDLLTFGKGIEVICQYSLQAFLWRLVPHRWPQSDWQRVAEALAQVLELCDRPAYAAICRSPQTASIFGAYRSGSSRGLRKAVKLEHRTGVVPPDLPPFKWSLFGGEVERDALWSLATSLEAAIRDGEFVPGQRGWRATQKAIAERELLASRSDLDGASFLDVVHEERFTLWTAEAGPEQRRIVHRFADELRRPIHNPDGFGALADVLERGRAGVRVEPETPDNFRAVILLDMGLFAKAGRTLRTTAQGTTLITDPEELWRRVVRHLWEPPEFHNHVAEVAFALLLDAGALDENDLTARMHPHVTQQWADAQSGRPMPAQEVRLALVRLTFLGGPLGVLDVDGRIPGNGEFPNRRLSLTPAGRTTALEVLRIRATAPRI